jgi:hypothetical protein
MLNHLPLYHIAGFENRIEVLSPLLPLFFQIGLVLAPSTIVFVTSTGLDNRFWLEASTTGSARLA